MQSAFFTVIIPLVVVAVVQFYKQLRARDFEGAVTIGVAAVVGVLAGGYHYMGLDIETGLTLALGAVGLHTVTKNIG